MLTPVNHVLCIEERPLATLILCLRGKMPRDIIGLITTYATEIVHMREIMYENYPIGNKLIISQINIKYMLDMNVHIYRAKVISIETHKVNRSRSVAGCFRMILNVEGIQNVQFSKCNSLSTGNIRYTATYDKKIIAEQVCFGPLLVGSKMIFVD